MPPHNMQSGVIPGAGIGSPDRVWGSCGLKLNIGNYQSASVDAGMSTDVRSDETPQDAISRVFAFVVDEVNQQATDLRAALDSPPEPSSRKRRN